MSSKQRKTLPTTMADNKEFTIQTRDTSPAHLLIRIESFSKLSKYGIQKYESREFEAGEYKWRLIIYPNGHESDEEGEHVAAYLSMAETSSLPVDWEVNAIFNVLLLNQKLDNYLCFQGKARRFNALNSKWGFLKMISKEFLMDQLNGYLVDDNCVFGAEVFVHKRKRVIECVSVLEDECPCKRDWKISQFSKLGDVWTSEEISTGHHKWKVKLYPNGNGSGKSHSVSIYMECVDAKSFAPHQKVMADFCMRIKNKCHQAHRSTNLSHWFTSDEVDWGLTTFIPIADIRDPSKGFVVDDCCFLEVEISVKVVVGDAPKLK